MLPHDNDSCYDSECDLRCNKPEPVNVAREQRIEKFDDRVQQTGPEDGANQAAQHDGPPRKHGKHRAIEQPDQDGHEAMDTDITDKMESETYILQHGHYQIEVMANLDKVPPTGALIVVTWPKVEKGLGFPARAFAILP